MNTLVQQPAIPPEQIRLKPARALLGWLPDQAALNLLAIGQPGRIQTPTMRARWQSAQASVATREPHAQREAHISEPPKTLDLHIARLRQDPNLAQEMASGWRVACVDLREVRAFQPHVVLSVADESVAGLKAGQMAEVANVTLPARPGQPINCQFVDATKTWMVTSRSHNLRIFGPNHLQLPGALPAFGFAIGELNSMVRVHQLGTKLVLADGYHRAVGLLRAGFTEVPVFLRAQPELEGITPPAGMLPQSIFLSDRAPLLPDYLDDQVSAEVMVEESYKMILITAQEIAPGIYK